MTSTPLEEEVAPVPRTLGKLYLHPAHFYWVDNRVKKQRNKDRKATSGRDLVMPRQRWEKTRDSKKATTFPHFLRLPRELQIQVWKAVVDKPGIHFLAAALKKDSPVHPYSYANPYAYREPLRKTMCVCRATQEGEEVVDTTEVNWWDGEDGDPSHRGRLCLVHRVARTTRLGSFVTYAEGFPAGRGSTFSAFEGAMKLSNLSVKELRALHNQPFDVRLGDGRTITIDAASDLIYIKFFSGVNVSHDPLNRCHTYSRLPDIDLLVHRRRNDQCFSGIHRVAIEVDPLHLTMCMIPTQTKAAGILFQQSTCNMCRRYKRAHGRYDEGMRNVARFLHAFPDLREVFLVFPWHPHARLDGEPGRLYCASGHPPRCTHQFKDPALRARRTTQEDAAGKEFCCGGGGVLREPTGVADKHAALVDVYQWWFNDVWEVPGPRPRDWLRLRYKVEAVQFRMLVWGQEEELK